MIKLIYGEEGFMVLKAKEKFIKESGCDVFNLTVYNENPDMGEAKIIAETFPFLSPCRTIIFDHTDILKTDITEFLDAIPPTTNVLFLETSVDKKYKSYKWIAKNAEVKEYKKLSGPELKKWIIGYGYDLDIDYFLEKTGDDMFTIFNELQKLAGYVEGKTITREDIDTVTTDTVEDKIFDMLDAIANKSAKKALSLYKDLLSLKTPLTKILIMLERHYRILMKIKACKNGNKAQTAGIAPFLVKKYQLQADKYEFSFIKGSLEKATQLDLDIRSGKIKDQIGLECLICELAS